MLANPTVLLALLFAIGAGIAIAVQSTLVTASTTSLQPLQLAFWVHIGGAMVGAILLVLLRTRSEYTLIPEENTARVMVILLIAGGLGMIILPFVALSLPTLGLVTGEVAIIGGQFLVSLAVDTFGLAGGEPIPLDWQRIAGLVLMIIAVYLLLPKTQAA